MLRVIQDPYKDRKKDLVQHGKCVLHKVLNSYFFLGSQRMPRVPKNAGIIPTRCSYLRLKRICLVNMISAILIILTIHIIIAIRWMLIKILSAVINDWERIKVIVLGGCCLDINIIRKNKQKSRCCGTLDVRIFAG